jgi:hypothetical protein
MRRLLAAIAIAIPVACLADATPPAKSTVARNQPDTFPNLPALAARADNFAPVGWRVEKTVAGDINGDGIGDLVIVLRKTDPANVITLSADDDYKKFDTNPRMLAIALGTRNPAGYALAVTDHKLIPAPSLPEEGDMLFHPFDPLAAVELRHGILTVRLHDGAGGDWGGQDFAYKYRFNPSCMRLIGMDQIDFPTCKGCDGTQYSANYLTGKEKRWNFLTPQRVHWKPADAPENSCLGDK